MMMVTNEVSRVDLPVSIRERREIDVATQQPS